MGVRYVWNRIASKNNRLFSRLKQGGSLNDAETRTADLLRRLQLHFDEVLRLDNGVGLIQERNLGKVVDNAVVLDPVGCGLYEFGWEGKLPNYVGESWFVGAGMKEWMEMGDCYKTRWKRSLMAVSDEKTWDKLRNASDEEWFNTWMKVEFIYDERHIVDLANGRMALRQMKKKEYFYWAKRFGVVRDIQGFSF
jgi:hypothetical protein